MPHLIQRYRSDRDDESQSPLMSLAETADKELGDGTPSIAGACASTSTSGDTKTASSVITPSNTPENNSNNKRSAAEGNAKSIADESLCTPKDSKDYEVNGKGGSGGSDKESKTDPGGIPIVPSSASTAKSPASSDNYHQTSALAPWYSPNPSQTAYQYPPHPHMGMNMGMYPPHPYPPHAYPPPHPYMTPGMHYPHSPYPQPHVTPNGPHPPHMFSHPYGFHNASAATPTVATPKAATTPNHGDENSTTSTSDVNGTKNRNTNDIKEENGKEPNAKRVKIDSSASTSTESDSNAQATTTSSTPHHPQTPQPAMPVPPPPHYYPYYPPHAHAHPHVHPHPHPHTPHAPPNYYPPRPQEDSSTKGESLKRCERIAIPKGNNKTTSGNGVTTTTPSKSNAEFIMPSFQSLVNFPSSIHRRMKSTTELRCVMCGEPRPSSHSKKDENAHTTAPQQHHIIPKQNKGLCTACDVAVWMIKDEQVEIKWCKGCKNFRTWTEFGDKPCATKCGRCREKQKEKYAMKVGRFEGGSAKKEKSGDKGTTLIGNGSEEVNKKASLKGNENGLSFLIAATNQVSKA